MALLASPAASSCKTCDSRAVSSSDSRAGGAAAERSRAVGRQGREQGRLEHHEPAHHGAQRGAQGGPVHVAQEHRARAGAQRVGDVRVVGHEHDQGRQLGARVESARRSRASAVSTPRSQSSTSAPSPSVASVRSSTPAICATTAAPCAATSIARPVRASGSSATIATAGSSAERSSGGLFTWSIGRRSRGSGSQRVCVVLCKVRWGWGRSRIRCAGGTKVNRRCPIRQHRGGEPAEQAGTGLPLRAMWRPGGVATFVLATTTTITHEDEHMSAALDLSESIADLVESNGKGIVRIDARRWGGATGTVWSEDGLIVTAHHVLDRDEGVTVVLTTAPRTARRSSGATRPLTSPCSRSTRRGFTARTGRTWTACAWATSPSRSGARARPSARRGASSVRSATPSAPRGGKVDRYVQTDGVVPSGFSGGPLLDFKGRVLGINSTGVMRGVNVGGPLATVQRVVGEVQAHGQVRKGYLGVGVYPGAAARERRVAARGPAERARARRGRAG